MSKGVVVIQKNQIVRVKSSFPIIPQYQPFSFIATAAQTFFTLPNYPVLTGLFILNVNGVAQNELNGDFTVAGNVVTYIPASNNPLAAGDIVSGFYQVASPANKPAVANYQSFILTATQGQTAFTLPSVPQIMILVAINGTAQSAVDYSVSGNTLTMTAGLNAGDKLFGIYIAT